MRLKRRVSACVAGLDTYLRQGAPPSNLASTTSVHHLLASCREGKFADLVDELKLRGLGGARTRSREHVCPRCAVAFHSSPTPRPAPPLLHLVPSLWSWPPTGPMWCESTTFGQDHRDRHSLMPSHALVAFLATLSTTSTGRQLKKVAKKKKTRA